MVSKILKNELEKYKNISKYVGNYWDLESCMGIKYESLIAALFPVDNYKTVIDVGCGPAHLIKHLSVKYDYLVCGVEPCRDKIQNFYDEFYDQVVFEGTSNDIPFDDKCCDLLISTDVLEHIPETYIPKTLKEFNRTARKAIFLTISLQESKINYKEKNLHVTVKPREWWLEKIKENIDGHITPINIIHETLVLRIDLEKIVDVKQTFTNINKIAKVVRSYEKQSEFYSLREVLAIQNYNAIKNLGFSNFIEDEQKFEKILLVGAGPNFSKYINIIRDKQRQGYSIWGCNHVINGLLKNDIEPDFIIGTETRDVLLKTLLLSGKNKKDYKYKNIVLHASAHPEAFQDIKAENKFYYLSNISNSNVNQQFLNMNQESGLTPYGSVSCCMFDLAMLKGPKIIETIGYDYYIEDKPYDKYVPFLNDTKRGQFIFDIKQPVMATMDGVEYQTTWLYKSFAIYISILLAKMKVLHPDIEYKRIGSSPLKFGRRDDDFLAQFKKSTNLNYYEFIDRYSVIEVIDRVWAVEGIEIPINVWMFCMIPDKILKDDFNIKDFSEKEQNFIKEKIGNLYINHILDYKTIKEI